MTRIAYGSLEMSPSAAATVARKSLPASPRWTRNDTLSSFVSVRLETPRSGSAASDAALIGIPLAASADAVPSSPLRSTD